MRKQGRLVKATIAGLLLPLLAISLSFGAQKKKSQDQPPKEPSPIDRLLATTPVSTGAGITLPGSTFSATAPLLGRACPKCRRPGHRCGA